MTRREFTRRVIEHTVDCRPPWGATIADFHKAWTIASHEYRELNGIDEAVSLPDDAIRIHPSDEEIILRFEIKKEVGR